MSEIRIALAAETILYSPIYLIASRLLLPNHTLTIIGSKESFGDVNAYDRLGSDADICIADPMVCVPTNATERTRGKIVATLVEKAGLWGLSTSSTSLDLEWKSPFVGETDPIERRIVGVSTYNTASTAGRIMEYVKSHGLEQLNIYEEDFGTELKKVVEPHVEPLIDIVVTCDLVGALAIKHNRHALKGSGKTPKLVSEFCEDEREGGFGHCLFTAVIASDSFLSTKGNQLREFLKALHDAVESFYAASESELGDMAKHFAATRGEMFPAVGPGRIIDLRPEERVDLILQSLKYLQDHELFARSLVPDFESWSVMYQFWGFEAKRSRKHFRSLVVTRFARSVSPGKALRVIRLITREARLPVGSIMASWVIFAATAGQIGFTGIDESGLILGLSIMCGGLIWLFRSLVLDHE